MIFCWVLFESVWGLHHLRISAWQECLSWLLDVQKQLGDQRPTKDVDPSVTDWIGVEGCLSIVEGDFLRIIPW